MAAARFFFSWWAARGRPAAPALSLPAQAQAQARAGAPAGRRRRFGRQFGRQFG